MHTFSRLLDIIYPPRCHICEEFLSCNKNEFEDDNSLPICISCLHDLTEITPPLCPVCGIFFKSRTEESHMCEDCLRKKPFYDATGAPYLYEGGLMTAIQRLKYRGKVHLADSLGRLLASFTRKWLENGNDCLIMPVPLHPKRLRERGFNQSLLLAKNVCSLLDMELDFLSLRRVRYTQPQTELSRSERRKNVRRAFEVHDKAGIKKQTIILVDDVATTGTTLNECARVLKRAGCKKVFCVVLARTHGT